MICHVEGGSATVTIPNVNQSNGVIHVVHTARMLVLETGRIPTSPSWILPERAGKICACVTEGWLANQAFVIGTTSWILGGTTGHTLLRKL